MSALDRNGGCDQIERGHFGLGEGSARFSRSDFPYRKTNGITAEVLVLLVGEWQALPGDRQLAWAGSTEIERCQPDLRLFD